MDNLRLQVIGYRRYRIVGTIAGVAYAGREIYNTVRDAALQIQNLRVAAQQGRAQAVQAIQEAQAAGQQIVAAGNQVADAVRRGQQQLTHYFPKARGKRLRKNPKTSRPVTNRGGIRLYRIYNVRSNNKEDYGA